ncbi:MAG: peptidoglycan-binding protein [Proteobacteria bacterium]|nr:peptidoglycan-binding protein [Pseudomonadota bacterium]
MTRPWMRAALIGGALVLGAALAAPAIAQQQAAPPRAGGQMGPGPGPKAPAARPANPTVKALQEALAKAGFTVKADGLMGPETRAALRKYQEQHHLPVTGRPDPETLAKLGVSPAPAQPARPRAGGAPGGMGAGGGMMGPGQAPMAPGGMTPGRGGMGPGQPRQPGR